MDTQRIILFVIFSFSLFLLWEAWHRQHNPPASQEAGVTAPHTPRPSAVADAPPANERLRKGRRLKIQTDVLYAEIDTHGADLRRLELLKHQDSGDQDKPFTLFDDQGGLPYVAQSGWLGGGLPTHQSEFTPATDEDSLQLDKSQDTLAVRLEWRNSSGLRVERIYTFHRGSYVVDVEQRVVNGGPGEIDPYAYFQLLRNEHLRGGKNYFMPTFTGGAVYTDKDKFQKIPFADIKSGKDNFTRYSDNGWVAIIEHYFLSAWLPPEGTPREYYAKAVGEDYAVGAIVPIGKIVPGESHVIRVALYAGPQEQEQLEKVAPGLSLTVDYGWLTIVAAPLFWALSKINAWVHNWGVAIILLTVLIKLIFYPLSAKSYQSMAQMRKVAPRMQQLKEQYADDRVKMQQAVMELYKSEKINPLGGCLPIVVQIPVFIALYWVLIASVEIRHAPFVLWIKDLSAIDPYYVLPAVMGITMIIQTRLNPTPPDPVQARVMMIMPIVFSVFFFFFPAGLVLYWLVNNVLSIAQQWYVMRTYERPAKSHARN
jgi:YidC/Oxa1 family membrane protein insertase